MSKTFRQQNIDASIRCKEQINASCNYLFKQPLFCLGTNDPRSATFINSLKMPALPLLADNKEQRTALLKQNRNMIQKLADEIKHSVIEEANRPWIESKGYHLEDTEMVNENAMSIKEFENWCTSECTETFE
jgi:hypothetical protein